MQHPRLLFDQEAVPFLVDATTSEDLLPLWETWLEECRREAREPVPSVSDFEGWAVELQYAARVGKALEAQSFASLLTGDAVHRQRAHDLARALAEMPLWVAECHSGGGRRRFGLTSGVAAQALALYIDWLGDDVGGTRMTLVQNAIDEKGIDAYLNDRELPGWFQQRSLNNWIAVMCGGLGMALLATEFPHARADEVLQACIYHTERYLRYIHHDGSIDESGGYWIFGFGHALRFAAALKRLEICDWFETYPQIRATAGFPLALNYGGEYAVEFGDCERTPLAHFVPLILGVAREYRDEGLQFVARRILRAWAPLEAEHDHIARRRLLEHWQTFAWYDETLPAEASAPSARVGSRVFDGAQWGLLRSGTLFVAIRGGDNARSHCHWDLNNVVLFAHGAELLSDHARGRYSPDYWSQPYGDHYKDTRGHNCLLVNGVGQKNGLDCTARVFGPTIVRQDSGISRHSRTASPQESAQYLFSEGECLYGEDQFAQNVLWDRHLVLVDGEWLLIVDDVRADTPLALSWLFHTRGSIEIDDEGAFFRCGNVGLNLEFMAEQDCSLDTGDDQDLPYLRVELDEPTDRATLITLALPETPDIEAPSPEVEMMGDGSLTVQTEHGQYIVDVPRRALWLGAAEAAD